MLNYLLVTFRFYFLETLEPAPKSFEMVTCKDGYRRPFLTNYDKVQALVLSTILVGTIYSNYQSNLREQARVRGIPTHVDGIPHVDGTTQFFRDKISEWKVDRLAPK